MKFWLSLFSSLWATAVTADNIALHEIPIESQGTRTFYVQSNIHGSGESMLLIDTGSGHSVINEETLADLISSGNAAFLKNLRGLMADGSTRIVPLYRIAAITIGEHCVINDVDAVVLPNNVRQILGISALQKTAPFGLSFDPPILSLSQCNTALSDNREIENPESDKSPRYTREDDTSVEEASMAQSNNEKSTIPEKEPAAIPEDEVITPDQVQAINSTG